MFNIVLNVLASAMRPEKELACQDKVIGNGLTLLSVTTEKLTMWNNGFQDTGHWATKCSDTWLMGCRQTYLYPWFSLLPENSCQDERKWNPGIIQTSPCVKEGIDWLGSKGS